MFDTTNLLSDFLKTYGAASLTDQCAAIRRACDLGGGSWMTPQDAPPSRSPATYQHEIALYGVSAYGDTARAAVSHWFKAATAIADGQVAA
ncbi:hypothetical protein [Yoonia sp. 208BN28-4]|uniref:hypothetical protein n=1 Tax=Yoonia sp. 208BN28-4 TaxID=3126505 RepID=UPI0030A5C15F